MCFVFDVELDFYMVLGVDFLVFMDEMCKVW